MLQYWMEFISVTRSSYAICHKGCTSGYREIYDLSHLILHNETGTEIRHIGMKIDIFSSFDSRWFTLSSSQTNINVLCTSATPILFGTLITTNCTNLLTIDACLIIIITCYLSTPFLILAIHKGASRVIFTNFLNAHPLTRPHPHAVRRKVIIISNCRLVPY